MALQRCILQTTHYFGKRSALHYYIKKTYCEFRHKYSTQGRKYTHHHDWVTVDKDIGTIGISKYAQESLGDVVFADLPAIGTKLNAGDECGALESVKAVSELYSPVTGIVIEKNKEVEKKPALINTSCYDKGWLFKLKLTKLEEICELMDEEQYKTFLKTDSEKHDK